MAPGKGAFRAPRGALALEHFILFPAGATFFRVQQSSHNTCVFFDTVIRHRFNAPQRQFGTWYLGTTPEAALVESVLHDLDTTSDSRRVIYLSEVQQLTMWRVTLRHEVRLVDFHGRGLALNHIDLQLCTGRHATARAWSLSIWKHPVCVNGIHYPARHNNLLTCVALFSHLPGKAPYPPSHFDEERCGVLLHQRSRTILPEFSHFLSDYAVALI
jgi:hypothetical protein